MLRQAPVSSMPEYVRQGNFSCPVGGVVLFDNSSQAHRAVADSFLNISNSSSHRCWRRIHNTLSRNNTSTRNSSSSRKHNTSSRFDDSSWSRVSQFASRQHSCSRRNSSSRMHSSSPLLLLLLLEALLLPDQLLLLPDRLLLLLLLLLLLAAPLLLPARLLLPETPLPFIPDIPANATVAYGVMRLEGFEFAPSRGQMLFMCPVANLPESLITTTCRLLNANPLNRPDESGAVAYAGNYNVAFPTMDIDFMVELVFVQLEVSVLPERQVRNVVARSLLCDCNASSSYFALQGFGTDSGRDLGKVVGFYGDLARFFLCCAVLLLLECVLSLLLTWERRHFQMITIFICFLVMVQDALMVLFVSRSVLSAETDAKTVCLGLGSVFHLFVMSALAWYTAASVHVFFVFFNTGQYMRYSYTTSSRNAVMYHICCWTFVFVDWIIVWGLYGASPSLSYGPVKPYAFCWIETSSVLIGAFYAPAIAVLALSLVLTCIVCFQVFRVRRYHKKINFQSIAEIVSIFLTCSGGLIALVVLGSLLVIYADDNVPYMLLVASLLFFVQALSLWVVLFPRRHNMVIWAMMASGELGQLQRANSSMKEISAKLDRSTANNGCDHDNNKRVTDDDREHPLLRHLR